MCQESKDRLVFRLFKCYYKKYTKASKQTDYHNNQSIGKTKNVK